MKPGEVRAVRELTTGVQAQVCLGADVKHGYANMTVVCSSLKVLRALDDLKDALREEGMSYVRAVLDGQAEWEKEKAS